MLMPSRVTVGISALRATWASSTRGPRSPLARAAATKSDSMTSSMPTRRLLISTGAIAMAEVSPGSTSARRWPGSVAPQPRAELRALLRAGMQAEHHARRVAGNEPQQQEGDDGHAEYDRDRGGQPPRRVTEPRAARPAPRGGGLGGRRRRRPG